MNKKLELKELTKLIANRSSCNIKVGAVIFDQYGIFSWGWNHSGSGNGECAEKHAIKRANKARLDNASIAIVAIRRGKIICSIPCISCDELLRAYKIRKVFCTNGEKKWITISF